MAPIPPSLVSICGGPSASGYSCATDSRPGEWVPNRTTGASQADPWDAARYKLVTTPIPTDIHGTATDAPNRIEISISPQQQDPPSQSIDEGSETESGPGGHQWTKRIPPNPDTKPMSRKDTIIWCSTVIPFTAFAVYCLYRGIKAEEQRHRPVSTVRPQLDPATSMTSRPTSTRLEAIQRVLGIGKQTTSHAEPPRELQTLSDPLVRSQASEPAPPSRWSMPKLSTLPKPNFSSSRFSLPSLSLNTLRAKMGWAARTQDQGQEDGEELCHRTTRAPNTTSAGSKVASQSTTCPASNIPEDAPDSPTSQRTSGFEHGGSSRSSSDSINGAQSIRETTFA